MSDERLGLLVVDLVIRVSTLARPRQQHPNQPADTFHNLRHVTHRGGGYPIKAFYDTCMLVYAHKLRRRCP